MEETALTHAIGRFHSTQMMPPVAAGVPLTARTVSLRVDNRDPMTLAGIAHDARNLVTALGLCADLMSEPGVLPPLHGHFANEVRSIAAASEQLVQRLSALAGTAFPTSAAAPEPLAESPVEDLADAVRQLSGLLSAMAGPAVELQMACLPCPGQLRLSEESLTRILVNLVRNAADAMPTGGRIRITTQRSGGASFFWTLAADSPLSEEAAAQLWDEAETARSGVLLTLEDNGPGIPEEWLERVFDAGFSIHGAGQAWPQAPHHGLGLSIVRRLVEEAGGTVRAVKAPTQGARMEIELPLTNVIPSLLSECAPGKGNDRQ